MPYLRLLGGGIGGADEGLRVELPVLAQDVPLQAAKQQQTREDMKTLTFRPGEVRAGRARKIALTWEKNHECVPLERTAHGHEKHKKNHKRKKTKRIWHHTFSILGGISLHGLPPKGGNRRSPSEALPAPATTTKRISGTHMLAEGKSRGGGLGEINGQTAASSPTPTRAGRHHIAGRQQHYSTVPYLRGGSKRVHHGLG